jgi:DNA ligase-1
MAKANGVYKVGSGKGGEFLKVKPLLSFTVTVTGAALDFGTKTGKNTAALKFMLDGLEQKVSTGLTQDQVNEITTVGWDGYRIEVEAMGKTVNGYLREPRFRGIRSDA